MPKEMLPIVDKPLIQYGVEEAYAAGMNQIAFVTGRNKRAIEDHFDTNYELEHEIRGTSREKSLAEINKLIQECTFSYTRQSEIRGLGHAILTGETLIGDESFGVVLADDLCVGGTKRGVLGWMVDVFEEESDPCAVIAVQRVPDRDTGKYGVVSARSLGDGLHEIEDLVEKPDPADAPSNLAIIGRYILTPDMFPILRQTSPGVGGEIQITDALRTWLRSGRILACEFTEHRFDCGSVNGFLAATQHFHGLRIDSGTD